VGNQLVGLAVRESVEARRVGEVLLRAHPLEEARLDRHPVDEPTDGARRRERIVPEDERRPRVVQQERREQADQGRLAGSVPAEDRDALAALDRERDAVQRRQAALAREASVGLHPAPELLAKLAHLDSGHTCSVWSYSSHPLILAEAGAGSGRREKGRRMT